MKKTLWIIALLLGLGLTFMGLQSTRVNASETEMYLDVITDTFEESYEESYQMHMHGRHRQPLLFFKVSEEIKEDILEKALELGIDPSLYILAVSLSTYDETYEMDVIVESLKTLEGEALDTYIETLKDAMLTHSEAIKETLDTLKDTFKPRIQAIRNAYRSEVRALITDIKNASEVTKDALLLELETLRATIEAEIDVVRMEYLNALEEENIAIEGLYGMFIKHTRGRIESVRQFEQRFPKLYDRMKGHMRG
jgi:hypothetical protein